MTNENNHAVPIKFYIYLNLTFEAYLPNIRDEKRMHDNRWAYAFCYMVVPSMIVIHNVRVFEYMCICLCISISNFTHMSNKVSKFTYYDERQKRYSLIQKKFVTQELLYIILFLRIIKCNHNGTSQKPKLCISVICWWSKSNKGNKFILLVYNVKDWKNIKV